MNSFTCPRTRQSGGQLHAIVTTFSTPRSAYKAMHFEFSRTIKGWCWELHCRTHYEAKRAKTTKEIKKFATLEVQALGETTKANTATPNRSKRRRSSQPRSTSPPGTRHLRTAPHRGPPRRRRRRRARSRRRRSGTGRGDLAELGGRGGEDAARALVGLGACLDGVDAPGVVRVGVVDCPLDEVAQVACKIPLSGRNYECGFPQTV